MSTFDFDRFLSDLRQNDCSPLVQKLKSFLSAFNATQRPILQQRRLVLKFIDSIYTESLQNPILNKDKKDEAAQDKDSDEDEQSTWIREGWEKLVMTKIYESVFCPANSEEPKMATHLTKKIQEFSWIQERHLDLPFSLESAIEVAQAELLKVNGFKSPRDKLVIIQNTVQLAVDLIKKTTENAGSDHLLPVLILIIIRANPPNIIANIKYIMRFRHQSELDKGQNQYYLTTMMGAVSFIYNLSIKSLTIPPEDFLTYNIQISPVETGQKPDLLPLSPTPQSPGEPADRDLTKRPRLTSQPSNPDLNKVITNTTGFFNSLFKDVAVTMDHFVDGVRGRPSNAALGATAASQHAGVDGNGVEAIVDENGNSIVGSDKSTGPDYGGVGGRRIPSNPKLDSSTAANGSNSNISTGASSASAAVTRLRSFSEGLGRTFTSLLAGDGPTAESPSTARRKTSMDPQRMIDPATRRAIEQAEREFDREFSADDYTTSQRPPQRLLSAFPGRAGQYPGNPNVYYGEDETDNNSPHQQLRQSPTNNGNNTIPHSDFHDPAMINRIGLTSPERAEIEEYELQLALALSLSAQEAGGGSVEGPASTELGQEPSSDASNLITLDEPVVASPQSTADVIPDAIPSAAVVSDSEERHEPGALLNDPEVSTTENQTSSDITKGEEVQEEENHHSSDDGVVGPIVEKLEDTVLEQGSHHTETVA
ncbi:hypothetical protein SmJEL517_g00316 [Synchytrium microbalum]|uniref:VPS9 domain-containing protein n=1 Tax=Synchytrium microbalum TaxID=1806994 RepID=A0A507CJQ9_9FUNG|nr:uncharacterized protein SmJEL517_g00316 [Synchytrium microbalum]TPX38075.1 hypothetical protein SmJEL517_g00316 [Synchytrium microbalum]